MGVEKDSGAPAQSLEGFEEGREAMTRFSLPTAGDTLTVVGFLHTAVGLAKYHKTLGRMACEGVIDTVQGDHEREAALWFLMCGASLMLTGRLARWTQLQNGMLPASTGPMLLGIGATGVALLPRSGFWALLVPAVLAFAARGRKREGRDRWADRKEHK